MKVLIFCKEKDCNNKFIFDGYIPESFVCANCGKKYTSAEVIKEKEEILKEQQ